MESRGVFVVIGDDQIYNGVLSRWPSLHAAKIILRGCRPSVTETKQERWKRWNLRFWGISQQYLALPFAAFPIFTGTNDNILHLHLHSSDGHMWHTWWRHNGGLSVFFVLGLKSCRLLRCSRMFYFKVERIRGQTPVRSLSEFSHKPWGRFPRIIKCKIVSPL